MAGPTLWGLVALALVGVVRSGSLRASDPASEIQSVLSGVLQQQVSAGAGGAGAGLAASSAVSAASAAAGLAGSADELHDLLSDITNKNKEIAALRSPATTSAAAAPVPVSQRVLDDLAATQYANDKADKAGLNPKIDYLSLPGVLSVKETAPVTPVTADGISAFLSPAVSAAPASEVLSKACGADAGMIPCEQMPVVTVQGDTMQWNVNGPNAGEPVTSGPLIEAKVHMVDHLSEIPSLPRPRDSPEPANYGPNATFHVFAKAAKDAKCQCKGDDWLARHELDMHISIDGPSFDDVYGSCAVA